MSTQCAIENCKTTLYNKMPGVSLHPCPTSNEMRNKWLKTLKSKCYMIDWSRSRICSRHFESRYFDSQRCLRENAIPTLFPSSSKTDGPKTKVDRLLNKMTQAELTADIKQSLARLKEPSNLDVFVNDDLRCKPDAPMEARLWLMVKKQDNLLTRLMDLVTQTKKHADILQNSLDESKTKRKAQDQKVESLKYIVKCLQEKHATLEEQVEILTAVESRYKQ